MRVVHLIDSLAPGGAERSLTDMTPHLIRQGLDLQFVVLHERPGLADEVRSAGATVDALGGSNRMAWVREATKLIRARRPDLVHTTLFDADVVGRTAARLAGVPVVSSLVNTPYGTEHRAEAVQRAMKVRAAQLADIATSRVVRRFRAVSQAVKDASVERLHLNADLVDVIPEGRDPARLGRASRARRAGARAGLNLVNEPVVLAVGRQEPQKGLDLLLRAVPALTEVCPDVQVIVAGREGRSSAELRSIVDALDLAGKVRLLGQRDDIAELFCAADVFVLPSRREGIPGVVQEAMALEVPIVASDIDPVREALGDPSLAELFRPGDVEGLAAALAKALGDPAAGRQRAALARERFMAQYDVAGVAKRILAFYQTALRQPSSFTEDE
jgi:glycosyltransferase involved in cell wall biosynthesis